jgi:drug/metabolite transporter (DMT)-like permease
MAVLVGLLASVAYGTSDFIGGLVSRRNHVFTVLLWGQFVGIAMVLFGLPFVGGGPPVASWLWISAVAGVAGVIGAALLFRGLAKGRMGVVGPITGVLAAALPVVFGLLTGERPSPLSLMGVVVALGAIALVSSSPDPDTLRADVGKGAGRGLPEAFGAGICFAAFFIILDGIGDDAGLWPVLGMRLSSVAISGSILVARRVSPRPAPGTGLGVLGGGGHHRRLPVRRRNPSGAPIGGGRAHSSVSGDHGGPGPNVPQGASQRDATGRPPAGGGRRGTDHRGVSSTGVTEP